MSHDGWQNSARSWILSFKPDSNGFRVTLMTLFFFSICPIWLPIVVRDIFTFVKVIAPSGCLRKPFQLWVLALTSKKQPSCDKCLLRIPLPRGYTKLDHNYHNHLHRNNNNNNNNNKYAGCHYYILTFRFRSSYTPPIWYRSHGRSVVDTGRDEGLGLG